LRLRRPTIATFVPPRRIFICSSARDSCLRGVRIVAAINPHFAANAARIDALNGPRVSG
jgi:hypothetical protein